MHPSFYMLEKELLQHRIIIRLPLLLLFFSLLIITMVTMSWSNETEFTMSGMGDIDVLNIQQGFSTVIAFGATLVSYLLSILYLSKAMCKDRQEGSHPFWRSMPVSDLLTHAVKLGCALLVIPLICSVLVLSSEFFLWGISLFNPNQVKILIGDVSLLGVLQNYVSFLFNMLLIAVALLPFAVLIFVASQLTNSPLLVVLGGIYALKIVTALLLPESGVDQFFYQFVDLPTSLILTTEPTQVIRELPMLSTGTMYILTVLFFMLSLSLQKHGELNLRVICKM